jgi:hypothetical protein
MLDTYVANLTNPSCASAILLIASLAKLEKSGQVSGAELQWLRGSVMRLVAEFSVLQETKRESESS